MATSAPAGGVGAALLRRVPLDRLSALGGVLARLVGPLTPAHRVGRANLRAAYPNADSAFLRATLRAAWDNLGRVGGEYLALDRLFSPERVVVDDLTPLMDHARAGTPVLVFTAHLGNWELAAVAAHAVGLPSAVVYRLPNSAAAAAAVTRIRAPLMGRLIRTRPQAGLEMAAALRGGATLGMLVDQRFGRGPEVRFFDQLCTANPSLARLARQFDCPVFGARVIRGAGARFRIAIEGPIALPRDAEGRVDVAATTQAVTSVVERWIREYPGQWLWFHRRWRR